MNVALFSWLRFEGRNRAFVSAAAASGRPLLSVVLEFPALHSAVTVQDKSKLSFCWRAQLINRHCVSCHQLPKTGGRIFVV